jgi:hypothetical protein
MISFYFSERFPLIVWTAEYAGHTFTYSQTDFTHVPYKSRLKSTVFTLYKKKKKVRMPRIPISTL